MKACIIVFSPSGNTKGIGELLQKILEENKISVEILDITGDESFFLVKNKNKYLEKKVSKHDILFIGAPVYAHHLQFHMKELLKQLPSPNNHWGEIAIPFVTYGGINSGIALHEAAKLLKMSGRKIFTSIKVSSTHNMLKTFMGEELSDNNSKDEIVSILNKLIIDISNSDLKVIEDKSSYSNYQNLKTHIIDNLIFNEKKWHMKRYPQIVINNEICIKCGKCIAVCPVNHLTQTKNSFIAENNNSVCIHCFNCISKCPNKSISLLGDLEKGQNFMRKILKKDKETPLNQIYGSQMHN
ncbi:MAG: EFR1 family ferrodoxin [Fusobacteriaceae bacterium]|nr:EFR1 family ferrodoxin [Fusobacteriaceae bacterium]